MRPEDNELLLKASLDELDPGESDRLQDLLARDPKARTELEGLKSLENLVSATPPASSFDPYFANRVMQRLEAERKGQEMTLADSLARMFYRLAPVPIAMAVALFAFSAVNGSDNSQSLIESALGLQAVTLDEAFTFDATYYAIDAEDPDEGGED
jgi:anti-sigma factor RsiW